MSFDDFSQSQKYVINLYLQIADRAPTQAELNAGRETIADSGVIGFANSLLDEANLEEADGVSNEDFVLALYDNLLGRNEGNGGIDQAGLDYWSGFLDGIDAISRAQLAVHFQYTATLFQTTGDPAVDALINTGRVNYETKTELAIEDLDPNDDGNGGEGEDGDVISIDDREVVSGTDEDNSFVSRGTLNEDKIVDGKGGVDTLEADLYDTDDVLTFETRSVENIFFRNQDVDGDDHQAELDAAVIDAELMDGVKQWWSKDSRADLVIEDVNIQPSEITEDITIGMRSTDNQVDYEVYFDQLSLRAAPDELSNSQVNYELRDLRTVGTNEAEPLGNLNIDGIRFELDGVAFTLRDTDDSSAIDDAKTYEELEAALQAALQAAQAENPALNGLSISLTGSFDIPAEFNAGNAINNAGRIVSLVDSDGRALENPSYTRNEDATGGFTLYGEVSVGAPETVANLITSNIVLDNVGSGSKGGDLVIGGMSTGDNSGSIGVEKFIVEVQRDSWLESMRSTNNDNANSGNVLSQIIVSNADGSTGDLRLDGNAPDPEGNQADGYDTGAYGIENIRLWDSTALEGSVTALTASLDEDVVAQYLDLADQAPNASGADNVDFIYNFGAGNDGLDLDVANEVSSHEDFVLSIDTGAGNDSVNLNLGLGGDTIAGGNPSDAVDTFNQALLNNVSIETGAGNDTVEMEGSGIATIETEGGDDTVYIAQDGQKANWALFNDDGVVAYDGTNLNALQSDASELYYLRDSYLTINYLGFEATVQVPTINGSGLATQREIGNAIKAAIANDPELSKLLTAQDGEGNILEITSLIDGATVVDTDLTFSMNTLVDGNGATQTGANFLAGLTGAEVSSLVDLLNDNGIAAASDDQAALATTLDNLVTAANGHLAVGEVIEGLAGDNSDDEENDSVINVAAGTNVVVLADDDAAGNDSNLTLVFDTQFTKTSVVNFESATAAVEKDVMDFTFYLDGLVSASGSTQSQVRSATTLNGDATTEANSVTILNDVGFNATDTFAGLNASNLLAAVNTNGNDPYGTTLTDASLNAAAAGGQPANFVGTITDQIVFVENGANDGEYKVFHLTSDTAAATAADYTNAVLIGTIDFGAELDATIDATIFA